MTVQRERVSLLDARSEVTRHLTPDERDELVSIALPVLRAGPGHLDLEELLNDHNAFGATVVDGLVTGSLSVGEQAGIHLLGPGDVLPSESELWPAWLGNLEFRTAAPVQLALFGAELLIAVHRWPRIMQGLYASIGEQMHRLSAQLVICQLPRVEDRVLAMLWLLAESWGHVTPSGVRLPLALTHETVGGLVGARRPTVTLALRKLTDDGALVPQESGWLLLERPPGPTETSATIAPTQPATPLGVWATTTAPAPAPDPTVAYAELRETVRRLREQHRVVCQETRERLDRVRTARARILAARRQIVQDPLTRRPPPSS
jgi:CRP/FNR family transcriptional regulator, cyclic AMP receptor protein